MVGPFSKFYCKIWVSFCLNTRKRFFIEVSFSNQQKEHRLFQKSLLGIFEIVLHLIDQHFFYVTISENFEHFQYFNFKTDFRENENFFQKTGAPFFS